MESKNALLQIRLLGEFSLTFSGKPVTEINTPRLQSLLAYLVLHRDAPQSRQYLAFLLWPNSSEAQARTNLRNLVHFFRRALPNAHEFLLADNQTLQWNSSAPFTLDAVLFEERVDKYTSKQVDRHEGGDLSTSLPAYLSTALGHYRGDLLPSCYDDWVLPERERLRQKFLAAVEQLIALLEAQRDYALAFRSARRQLQADPLREETYRTLMRLHALSGDRGGIVRFFTTCEAVLRQELGVEPSTETRAAYEQYLKIEIVAGQPARAPISPRRNNLPTQLTSFIGRERETSQVKELLLQNRLLTLTGAGGIGKTRLAVAVAGELLEHFRDGVWAIDLAPLADPALVPQTVASTLGVREVAGRPLTNTLADYLRAKNVLLIFDNCEHLADAARSLAEALLNASPLSRILATSREPLGTESERTWSVPSLAIPDIASLQRSSKKRVTRAGESVLPMLLQYESVLLFIDRAAAVLPTFALNEQNAAVVGQICRRTDGIPLAIELAAARVRMLSVQQIATRLTDVFLLLTRASPTTLPRHQTLRAAMDWSHASLVEQEKILFRRLAVFAGGFTLEAAEAVCSDQPSVSSNQSTVSTDNCLLLTDILDLLSDLVDKSLVVVVGSEEGEPVRYRLLEPIRQYAYEKLSKSGELTQVRARHLDFFTQLAEKGEFRWRGPEQIAHLKQMKLEHDNVRAALAWSLEEDNSNAGLCLARAMSWFWIISSHLVESRQWLESVIARAMAKEPTAMLGKAYVVLGMAQVGIDNQIGRAAIENGLRLLRKDEDKWWYVLARVQIGYLLRYEGNLSQSRAVLEESVALARELDDKWALANSLLASAPSLWLTDVGSAQQALEEGIALMRKIGDGFSLARALIFMGHLMRNQKDYERAMTFYGESLALLRERNEKDYASEVLGAMGFVLLAQGDAVQAQLLLAQGIGFAKEVDDSDQVANMLVGFGGGAGQRGQAKRAARLLGAAESIYNQSGLAVPRNSSTREAYSRFVESARSQLDQAAFAAAWAEGRAMILPQSSGLASLEQAIEYALEDRDPGSS